LPTKYGPKVRRRSSAKAAAGPTRELTPDFYPERRVVMARR
jgi:hypothetical protein